jgi:lysozyme
MNHVNGLDVSDYQNDVDWATAHGAGYSFGISKATEGLGNAQATFPDNMHDMRAIGMIAGAYHYLHWLDDPRAQAAHFLSVYQPQKGDLPPTLDCEAVPAGVSPQMCIQQISTFLGAIEPHLFGKRMLLYFSASFPDDHLLGGSSFSGHPIWVAAYNNDLAPPAFVALPLVKIWQWSDGANLPAIAGIHGNVDRNRFLGTLAELRTFCL